MVERWFSRGSCDAVEDDVTDAPAAGVGDGVGLGIGLGVGLGVGEVVGDCVGLCEGPDEMQMPGPSSSKPLDRRQRDLLVEELASVNPPLLKYNAPLPVLIKQPGGLS